jgi:hypothetical protein
VHVYIHVCVHMFIYVCVLTAALDKGGCMCECVFLRLCLQLHYILHCTALHYTTLHLTTTLHYTTLHLTTTLHYTTLHLTTTLHHTMLHYYSALHYRAKSKASFKESSGLIFQQRKRVAGAGECIYIYMYVCVCMCHTNKHQDTLHRTTPHFTTLHYTAPHYSTLRYTLHLRWVISLNSSTQRMHAYSNSSSNKMVLEGVVQYSVV